MEWKLIDPVIQESMGFTKVYKIFFCSDQYSLKWSYLKYPEENNLVGFFKSEKRTKKIAEWIEKG